MTDASFPDLPPDLQARLTAAGVVDAPSMAAAFVADPQLQADYEAFFAANRTQIVEATIQQILANFSGISHKLELAALWALVPPEYEERFIAAVAAMQAEAQSAGDEQLEDNIAKRLQAIRAMRQARLDAGAQIDRWLETLEQADEEGFVALWNELPPDLEETFVVAAAQRGRMALMAGDTARAERLGAYVEAMQKILQSTRSFVDQPPLNQALLRFLQVEHEHEAREVYAQLHPQLDSDEAQRLLDEETHSDSEEGERRIVARRILLRELRRK